MSNKSQQHILDKLNIKQLNPMQEETKKTITSGSDTVLLSPTGSGKTVAFLLPIIQQLNSNCDEIQVLILVPARELAIQIEQVMRNMGSGFKVNAVYGGTSGSRDKMDLKHRPAVLIGTPGRITSHLERGIFSIEHIKTLVLDEFDKSLEIGFENEMTSIIADLPHLNQRILTSATFGTEIPDFVGMQNPSTINYLKKGSNQLELKTIISPPKDKLKTVVKTICYLGNQPGIIFCNFKDTIKEVSDMLTENKINHGCFHGGMEQGDRELTLIKFRNGTVQILLATDLAARGIDVPEIKFIMHYQLPHKAQEFTHRNGRTARMNNEGTAYIIKSENQNLPDFIPTTPIEKLPKSSSLPASSNWVTLHITGGRKDKISKGDIAGLFFKQGQLKNDELGIIELQQQSSYVSIKASKSNQVLQLLNGSKLKKKNIRIRII